MDRRTTRKGSLSKTRNVFVVGACSGAFLAANWRPVLKRSIAFAVKGGARAQKVLGRGVENLTDVTREVLAETQPSQPEPAATTDQE